MVVSVITYIYLGSKKIPALKIFFQCWLASVAFCVCFCNAVLTARGRQWNYEIKKGPSLSDDDVMFIVCDYFCLIGKKYRRRSLSATGGAARSCVLYHQGISAHGLLQRASQWKWLFHTSLLWANSDAWVNATKSLFCTIALWKNTRVKAFEWAQTCWGIIGCQVSLLQTESNFSILSSFNCH